MKTLFSFMAIFSLMLGVSMVQADEHEAAKSVHEFKVETIDGKKVDLSKYKGKVLLIVNVASKCGFTPQYKDLVALQDKFDTENFVVLGFPANEFGGQEPGTDEEIKEFCTLNYNVDFPMFSKVVVKGDEQVPLFKYLTTAENPDFKGDIGWNFEKFLIGKDGKLLHRYRSKVVPTDEKLVSDIKAALE